MQDDVLVVRVTAPPEKGRANEALIELLAEKLNVPKHDVRIVRGASARSKVIEVEGLTEQEAWDRLS